MSVGAENSHVVRHFRQIVLWPLQLVPVTRSGAIERQWEHLSAVAEHNSWTEVRDDFRWDPDNIEQGHYREFVTFLPFVQRFLYGSKVGLDPSRRDGEPSIRIFRRHDIPRVRITYSDNTALTFDVARADLYYFLDADIVLHALEICIDNMPLARAQDTMFRFGRAYPGFWDANDEGAHCPRLVEWLDVEGAVRASSDYGDRQPYLQHVARYRTPRLSAHWAHLLEPLRPADAEPGNPLRFRPLEYYRMPFMAYLAVDDPAALSRADFARIASRPHRVTAMSPPIPSNRSRDSRRIFARTSIGPARERPAKCGSWCPAECSQSSAGNATRPSPDRRPECWVSFGDSISCCFSSLTSTARRCCRCRISSRSR